jgi:Ca2+-binding RTX toxin-like protein
MLRMLLIKGAVSKAFLHYSPRPLKEGGLLMRRTIVLLATITVTLLVASGVAWAVNKIGTDGPDNLMGTHKADNLLGRGGNDRLFALAGNDKLLGGPGKDVVFGGNERLDLSGGHKILVGGSGNDFVNGGKGSDNLLGEEGNDLLGDGVLCDKGTSCKKPETSKDTLSGGDGNDVILVDNKPAAKDVVVCGGGFDRVLTDRADIVAPDCEKVVVVRGSLEDIQQQEGRFFDSIPPSFFKGLPQF